MAEPVENALIAEVARDAVRQVAPQELPRFRLTSQAYFEDPDRVLKGEKGTDQMLGFGTGREVAFLTPVVLAMTAEVVRFVTAEVAASLKEESPPVIRDLVRKMFKRFRPADGGEEGEDAGGQAPPALTPEQLARVRQVAYETARRLNLAEGSAALLADSVVGGMAVGSA